MTLYKHELKMNLTSFLIWLAGVLAMSAGCIFLFPLIDESMADMSDAFASMGGFSAAFGMDKLPITTLEGFFGTVDEMDIERQTVRVVVSMFGRETPVELDFDQIEPDND